MGLLDALFSGGPDRGGGLLDLLRGQQPTPDYGQTANIPIGNYLMPQFGSASQTQAPIGAQASAQPSPLDNAKWPAGPVGAPLQANAQMSSPGIVPQATMPVPTPGETSSPGFSDRLVAGLQGFTHAKGLLPALADGISGLATGQTEAQRTGNLTTQTLIKKGVDPEMAQAAVKNPEMLTALIKNIYADKSTSDTKNYEYGLAHPGFKAAQDTERAPKYGMTPIYATDSQGNTHLIQLSDKGSPRDAALPNGLTLSNNTLDDATTSAMAAQYLAGDRSVLTNLGRGQQSAANIVKVRKEIYAQAEAQGLNAKDVVNNFNEQAGALAGQRAVGTRAANISLAANEANNMIPIALEASDKLPRTQYMPWNQMVQTVQKGKSSPELASFVAATNSLVNSYVRAVSPSGVPTDSMREHAYSMLNAAQGPEAYKAVVATMQQEMKAALQAPSQVKKELRGEKASGQTESQGKAGDEILRQARDAIVKGAPREKVIQRLRENGLDPGDL